MRPRVSVIIPNYNHSRYLRERIDSVLSQTYQDFEVIILDDHSTDNSREIIQQYASNPRISSIVLNELNSGSTFKQWEKGWSLAKGEFLWIAESDDSADHRFLEEALATADSQEAGIVYTDSYQIDEKGHQLNRWSDLMKVYEENNLWFESFSVPGILLLSTLHAITNTIPNASCVLIRKSIMRASYFEEIKSFKYAGDWLFWGRCYREATVAYIHKPLNYFRTHSGTTRSAKQVKKQDLYEYYHCIEAFVPYMKDHMRKLYNRNMEELFKKWHFNSPKYFLENFSWKRYEIARRVDSKINSRIGNFLLRLPIRVARKLVRS